MDYTEYLQNNFKASKVEQIVVNGEVKGYYARSSNGDEIYLPANTTGSVGMLSYIPGAGGSGNDAAKLRTIIHNNPPSYPITIAYKCSDNHNCIETGYNLAKGVGMDVTQNVTVCFSASGYLGIQRTEAFEDNHPDITSTVVSCEPYNESAYSYKNESNTDGLRNSNSKIIFVAPQRFHLNMQDEVKKMTESGLDASFLKTAYSGNSGSVHIATNADVLTSGMVDYLLGYADDFNKEPGNGKYSPNYELMKYNPQTGQYEAMSYDELVNSVVGIRIPDLDKLKQVDAFNITTKDSPVKLKYQGLSSVSSKTLTGTTMKTEYTYSADQMNNIREFVSSSSFVSNFKNLNFRSGSGIPGIIGAYLNAYYDIVGSLLNSISLETDSVFSYTQAVVDLDNDLTSTVKGQIVQDGDLKGYIKVGLEEYQEKPKEEEQQQKPKDETPKPPGGGYTPTPPVQEPETPSEKEPTYRYKFDGYEGLIYTEGNKITEIKFRYTYASEAAAKEKVDSIKKVYEGKEFIKEIVQTGQYVDAVFKEESYKDKSYEEIVKEYFQGGKLNG